MVMVSGKVCILHTMYNIYQVPVSLILPTNTDTASQELKYNTSVTEMKQRCFFVVLWLAYMDIYLYVHSKVFGDNEKR